jgi:protease-4
MQVLCGVLLLGLTGCVMVNLADLFSDELEEVVLQEEDGLFVSDRVLLVDVSGIIAPQSASGLFREATCSPDYIKAVLNRARQDPRIKALLLRIDSPGGGVSATDMVTHEIKAFAEATGLPVYAHVMGVGASGGYYVATAADRIYAEPTAVTGSIGVVMMLPKLKGMAEKVGYEQVVIKSGEMKDIGNALRDMSDEEKKVFEDLVMSMYDRFLDTIMAGRPKLESRDQLRSIADGRIYTADQAAELDLVDGVAHLDEVIGKLKQAAGVTKAHVVTFAYRGNPEANIYSPAGTARPASFRLEWPRDLLGYRSGLHYLWLPGQ